MPTQIQEEYNQIKKIIEKFPIFKIRPGDSIYSLHFPSFVEEKRYRRYSILWNGMEVEDEVICSVPLELPHRCIGTFQEICKHFPEINKLVETLSVQISYTDTVIQERRRLRGYT